MVYQYMQQPMVSAPQYYAPQQMAYPAQLQQQPMQAPAYQQVLPRAAVQMAAPQRTAQLSVAPLGGNVGNVKTERAEARRTSFQMGAIMM